MLDKSKYASHGAFMKTNSDNFIAKCDKLRLGVINPIHENKAKKVNIFNQIEGAKVVSATFNAKQRLKLYRFRFQSDKQSMPIPHELVQPFLYIEKVIKKQVLSRKQSESGTSKTKPLHQESLPSNKTGDIKKQDRTNVEIKVQPFRTAVNIRKVVPKQIVIPAGYSSLYEYQQSRRVVAERLFSKLLQLGQQNLKQLYQMWEGKNKKSQSNMDINENTFLEFMKQLAPGRISDKQIKQFFSLYQNTQKNVGPKTISITAFSYNYDKYRKRILEPANLLSKKALNDRYLRIKNYQMNFDRGYKDLKAAMSSIQKYEEALRTHFRKLYEQYTNPFAQQIEQLQRQLQKPIIKYDKFKKEQLTSKISDLNNENERRHAQLTREFQFFMDNYEKAIVTNHDLMFTKRTINKLLLGIIKDHPLINRQLVKTAIEEQQNKKQRYLECLSQFIVELDEDKKHLGEDVFTLDEIVKMILAKKSTDGQVVWAMGKLIKEVKKQFLLKYSLEVESFDQFPSGQEIPTELIHTCFEMECTKVLLKNQIWTELTNFLPGEPQQISKLHQPTIDANLCMEYVLRYFQRLDQRIELQLKKSKEVSLLAENVDLTSFGHYGLIIEEICHRIINVNDLTLENEEEEEQKDQVQPLKANKVTFADIVTQAREKAAQVQAANQFLANKTQQREPTLQQIKMEQQRQMTVQREKIINSMIKSILRQPSPKQQRAQSAKQPGQQAPINRESHQSDFNLQDMRTLDKSFYLPEAINTSSFDIRHYEKRKNEEPHSQQVECVKLGNSLLLSNLPRVEEIPSQDPLRISRFLLQNIHEGVKEQSKIIQEEHLEKDVADGINHSYYKDKIKLQQRPSIYDCEGRTKYSMLLPVAYYQSFVAGENVPDEDKWYLRPHHVESLTENPLSKKDNIIQTDYQSRLTKLPGKKRPDQLVIEENVKRKEELIQSLEERILTLKADLSSVSRGTTTKGAPVPTTVLKNYLQKITCDKEDKDLELAAYEGVLYDLRRKEREILSNYRKNQQQQEGEPEGKWWERTDINFNNELRKDRNLVSDSLKKQQAHRVYVDKLKNKEIY